MLNQWHHTAGIGCGVVLLGIATHIDWHCEAWFTRWMFRQGYMLSFFEIGGFGLEEPLIQITGLLAFLGLVLLLFMTIGRLGFRVLCGKFRFRGAGFYQSFAVTTLISPLIYLIAAIPLSLAHIFITRRSGPSAIFDILVIIAIFFVGPAIVFRRQASRRFLGAKRCNRCGYWLYGLDGNSCPECGSALDSKSPSELRQT